jgi:hypothetical protein
MEFDKSYFFILYGNNILESYKDQNYYNIKYTYQIVYIINYYERLYLIDLFF